MFVGVFLQTQGPRDARCWSTLIASRDVKADLRVAGVYVRTVDLTVAPGERSLDYVASARPLYPVLAVSRKCFLFFLSPEVSIPCRCPGWFLFDFVPDTYTYM